MKTVILVLVFGILCLGIGLRAQVSVNTSGQPPHASSMLDVQSAGKGFLPPRMSTVQRNAINAPAEGLVIYNTDLHCLEFFSGTTGGWWCPCPAQYYSGCYLVEVSGNYQTGTSLGATHFLTVGAHVISPGYYSLNTGEINGYYFSARGVFLSTGEQQVVLTATGTPLFPGTDEFSLFINGEICYFSVQVGGGSSPGLFRSGIFLHHSTGGNIWGPNGSATSIPQEMSYYNLNHGLTPPQAVTMMEEWWSPSDNEWVTQHQFFEDPSPVTGIGYYLPDHPVIVIKTCFPASSMTGPGQPSDTLSPWVKSVYNYKWHWRHIIRVMESHPDNFFAIWTNAPLEPYSTSSSEAFYSREFSRWAKDTLSTGNDPVFGPFPPNVCVFDFFGKLTGPDGMMLSSYAAGPGDSHPNAAATALVAPQFVNEIFDAAISYEAIYPSQSKKVVSPAMKVARTDK